MINYLDLQKQNNKIKRRVIQGFKKSISSNNYILGDNLINFEQNFAKFMGASYVTGVANGTDALEIALRSLKLPAGSEVIVPTNSFVASAIAVLRANLKLVLADIDPHHLLLNLDQIEKVTSSKTRVIMPVHLFGQCAPMMEIKDYADDRNIFIVEDVAQAQGAKHFDRPAGSWGDISATSFYPGKNLGAWGDAGAVITDDPDLNKISIQIRNYGSHRKYIHEIYGFNSRMDELQAVVLNEKLKYLSRWNEERIYLASLYSKYLNNVEAVTIPSVIPGNKHIYHIYSIIVNNRDELKNYLLSKGIETLIHYPIPIHLQNFMKAEYGLQDFKVSESIATKILSLPLYPGLSAAKVEKISTQIQEFYKHEKV